MCSTILIISDKQRRGPTKRVSEKPGHVKMLFAGSMADAQEWIAGEVVDLTLIALKGPDDETFALVRQSLEKNQETRVLFFANDDELYGTLNALAKLPPGQLKKLISPKALSVGTTTVPFAHREITVAAASLETSDVFNEHELIGNSPEIEHIKVLVHKIAPVGTTILIQGEMGTGKKVIARTLHNHSSRKNEVFIPLDCAAIDEKRIEDKLFGCNEKSMSGTDRNTLGLIRSADKGTLFFDNIAELPIALQTKILRTIQTNAVKPVGSSKTYPVDIRIIATSNRNLDEAVKNGAFSLDLYEHLNAITLFTPPLRERRADIPILCTYFINKLFYEGYPKKQLSNEAITALCNYQWLGNILELEYVIRGALLLSEGALIESGDLSFSDNENN